MKLPASFHRLFFVVLFLVSLYFFSSHVAFAQTDASLPSTQETTTYNTPNVNADVPKNLHTWAQTVTIEVASAMICQLAGYDPINPSQECLGIDPETKKVGFVKNNGGILGGLNMMIVAMYTPPIHLHDYVSYMAGNFGFTKKAYAISTNDPSGCYTGNPANGVGLCSLSPFVSLWSSFRDVVYLLFVLLFAIIGLAIMLRIKIDPRTVMTIENQIPKIIIGLLLTTFSLAIAGFVIDLMWVMFFFITNIMTGNLNDSILGIITTQNISSNLFSSPFGFLDSIFKNSTGILGLAWDGGGSVGQIVKGLLQADGTQSIVPNPGCTGAWCLLHAGQDLLASIVKWIVTALGLLIVLVGLLVTMLRLWLALLKAYVFIILDIILAPFYIAIGLLPGSTIGFGSWLKDLVANLSAFPATLFLFLLAQKMYEDFPGSQGIFVPPLVGNPNGTTHNALGTLIALAIIYMTPQIVDMVKEFLKAPEFKWASGIGQGIGAGTSSVGRVVSGGVDTFAGEHYDIAKGERKGLWSRIKSSYGFTRH